MTTEPTDLRYPERATIRDVAERAGVSIGTASKALNDNGRLKRETRDKVIAAAQELGFRPNAMAQSLHRSKSMTVGILSTDSFGRFSFPIVEALEERLAEHGIAVFMCNATDDPAREKQHLDQLLGKRIDGLVVTARRSDMRPAIAVPGKSMPVIYVFSQTDDPDALCLVPDDFGGAVLGVEHLIASGRKRIAHLTGPDTFEAVTLRNRGYRAALGKAGLPEIAGYVRYGKWSEASGRDAVDALFDGKSEVPDALFCGNDQIARGATDALRERGLRVPQDVAVVGFDNWDVMALAARPPLTSVDLNLRALGRAAGERLIAMIAGERFKGVERLPCSLVVRQSSDPTQT
ncbi:LacI family DNA-binding transcriptional regulator [Devosia sp. SL43]|uniref:LacI family DNA-binding transcriptional regulator n=1 Tax=Devosia sp. SL43 TaxID=2806348 RepID=UPI001F3F5824|nr:LacI family DNA-binding transcriptional regulator [Devosia sp. SL43]UJW85085.1 LacI family DNA-binding transcriptional regulator [Devosia sp. SL43]